ncbi:hypothetical protein [Phytohabitans aurantiacus]|uniref:Uncharacterized protein n=1 Tax=Phytohabitans aurantiacus TaxID=3016789 RepID=A0ABQ5R355_9ACTN|nr:hypothetical protein [Phytohabitans aurantiacus]GLI00663.1 hypothetical protein Pa4123_59390 [Phytohabitans aurantiacus]
MSDNSKVTHQVAQPHAAEADLLERIEAYASACVTAARRDEHAPSDSDRDAFDVSRSAPAVIARHAELMSALDRLTRSTVRAVPDPLLPVRTWHGVVQVRAVTHDGSRAVQVRYTPAQAIATGTALIACGAVADAATGGTRGPILPPLPSNPTGVPATAEDTGTPVEHDCQAAGTLACVGVYGAPGVGQAWKCAECGRDWARVGARFYPAEDCQHILSPADCI